MVGPPDACADKPPPRVRARDVRSMPPDEYEGYKAAFLRELSQSTPEARRLTRPILAGAPSDPAMYHARFREELRMAEPRLRALAARLHRWTVRRVGRRPDRTRRRAVAASWNRLLRRRGWRTLPTFCESCGQPVFLRNAQNDKGGGFVIPTVCCRRCALTRKRARIPRRKPTS